MGRLPADTGQPVGDLFRKQNLVNESALSEQDVLLGCLTRDSLQHGVAGAGMYQQAEKGWSPAKQILP